MSRRSLRTKSSTIQIGPSFELRFDPTSSRAISVGRNISVWNLETKTRVTRSHPLKHPSHVNWSPDGEKICVKATSGELVIVDAKTLKVQTQLQSKRAGEGCECVFSPDGLRLLDGTWDGTLATYDINSQRRLLDHTFPECMVTALTSSPTYTRAATVIQPKLSAGLGPGPQHTICLVEWTTTGLELRTLPNSWDKIQAITFDSSENQLAILRQDGGRIEGCIEVVNLTSGHAIASRPCTLSWNGGSITWSPDGEVLGSVESDGFHFYDTTNLQESGHVPLQYACHVEFSRDGKFIALGAWSGGVVRLTESILGKES